MSYGEEDVDGRNVAYRRKSFRGGYEIVLPHQCDVWIIGDAAAARQLIRDLELLIKQLEEER